MQGTSHKNSPVIFYNPDNPQAQDAGGLEPHNPDAVIAAGGPAPGAIIPEVFTTAMVMPDMRVSVSLNPYLLNSVSLGSNLLNSALLDPKLATANLITSGQPQERPDFGVPATGPASLDALVSEQPEAETPQTGDLADEALEAEALETDTLEAEVPEADTLEDDVLEVEALGAETPEAEALEADVAEVDIPETDALEADTTEAETLETETPAAETPEISTLANMLEAVAAEFDTPETGAPEATSIAADIPEIDALEEDATQAETLEEDTLEAGTPDTDSQDTDTPQADPRERDSLATDKEVAAMLASVTMASEMIDMDKQAPNLAELNSTEIDKLTENSGDTDIGEVARLIELSRDRADNARSQLAANLAHFAITSGRDLATDEWALLDDIFIRLMQHMEAVVRKALAERIATMAEPPRQLVRALAYDEICVAGPVLRKAERLADEDLVAITRRMTHSHRIAIAEREGLTPLVSEALVEQGEYDVFQTLLKNRSARISKLTFRKLVRASEFDPAIQGLILERNGIPRSLLVEMFWFAAGACRQQIISRFDIELSVLKRQFHEGIEDALIELQTDPVAAAAVNIIRDSKPNCAALLEDLFSKVRGGDLDKIVGAVARMGGLNDTIARQVVLDPAGEALAILCKTMGIQKTQFVQLHLAMDSVRDGTPRPFSHISEITRLYETISWEAAEFILHYWAAENAENKVH